MSIQENTLCVWNLLRNLIQLSLCNLPTLIQVETLRYQMITNKLLITPLYTPATSQLPMKKLKAT